MEPSGSYGRKIGRIDKESQSYALPRHRFLATQTHKTTGPDTERLASEMTYGTQRHIVARITSPAVSNTKYIGTAVVTDSPQLAEDAVPRQTAVIPRHLKHYRTARSGNSEQRRSGA